MVSKYNKMGKVFHIQDLPAAYQHDQHVQKLEIYVVYQYTIHSWLGRVARTVGKPGCRFVSMWNS